MMNAFLIQLVTILSSLFLLVSGAFAYEHTVMLRVVTVTPDWMPYASIDGWTQAVLVKESNALKYFEVAIWEETGSVHLYEFPNDYDVAYKQDATDQEKIAYREQFALKTVSGMPSEKNAKSSFLLTAFISFIDIISDRYPNSSHALSYSGHGGPGGALFHTTLAPKHAQQLLAHWTTKLQSRLAVIDMGGPCNKGSFSDLNAFCPFSEYYIASDLSNGGYTLDDNNVEDINETNPDHRYHDLIANNSTLLQVLEKRIDITQQRYEYSRQTMITNKVEQANYLYSCRDFKKLYTIVEPIQSSLPEYSDLRNELVQHGEAAVAAFDATIIRKADNKDFFAWEVTANGMLTPNSRGFEQQLEELSYPALSFESTPATTPETATKATITPLLLPLLFKQ